MNCLQTIVKSYERNSSAGKKARGWGRGDCIRGIQTALTVGLSAGAVRDGRSFTL